MRALILLALLASPAAADPLAGKSYIIQLSSSQYESGYGHYLVPPLAKVLKASGMQAKAGPGADLVANIETGGDTGRWVGAGAQKVWIYKVTATVGLSPESYNFPDDGKPQFGVRAVLETPNPDREDEMDCLITLAAQVALRDYRPKGLEVVDGQGCLRKP